MSAWDSNPAPQNGRCRRIHWAIPALYETPLWSERSCNHKNLKRWDMRKISQNVRTYLAIGNYEISQGKPRLDYLQVYLIVNRFCVLSMLKTFFGGNLDYSLKLINRNHFNRKNQFLSLIIIPRVVHFKWSLKLIFSRQHCPCLALSVPNHFTFNPSIWKAFCLSVFLPSKTDLNTDVTSVYLLQLTIFVQIVNRNLC